MDAKCLYCNSKAHFDIDLNKIICSKCNKEIDYDEYIENMKDKALSMADEFQNNWDRY
jgi:hypothetical protein